MALIVTRYLSIPSLRKLTGCPIRDAARVEHVSYEEIAGQLPYAGRTIERRDRRQSSPLHDEMKRRGIEYYGALHFRVFPRNVGLWNFQGVYRFADFAVAKGHDVLLVEALTPWNAEEGTIKRKLQLEVCCPVAFISAQSAAAEFRAFGFRRAATLGQFDDHTLILFKK